MSLAIVLFSTLSTAKAEPTTDVGVFGSWQTLVFNGDTWRQQQRIHLRTSIQWDSVEAYIDLMDARIWGSKSTTKPIKTPLANLYQGYVRFPVLTIGGVEHTVQVGRRNLFSTIKDISPLDFGRWAVEVSMRL